MAASSDPVRADVEWIARDYWAILKAARPEELDLPTNGTAWTNRQLLFHMLLGQRVTRMVIVVMGVFSRLPAGASRAWAAGMAAVTPLYHRLNFAGCLGGGRLITVARWWSDGGRHLEDPSRLRPCQAGCPAPGHDHSTALGRLL